MDRISQIVELFGNLFAPAEPIFCGMVDMDFLGVFSGPVRQQTVQIIADAVTGLDIFSGNDEEYMVMRPTIAGAAGGI